MFGREKRIESGADASLQVMRMRNRRATQPLFKLLFLLVFLCTIAMIGIPLAWLITQFGFVPDRDEGLVIAGALAVVATGVAILLTERLQSVLSRWFFL
jgi:hypothetical protein